MTGEQHVPSATCCRNCGHELPPKARFCPACGQKASTGLMPAKELLHDFLETVLHLDSRLLRTLRDTFVPGRLTTRFFEGKHQSYYKPLRLFFTSLIVFLGILGLKYFNKIQDNIREQMSYNKYLMQRNVNAELDQGIALYQLDSLAPTERQHVDSFITSIKRYVNRTTRTAPLLLLDTTLYVPMHELHDLTPDSLINTYAVSGWINRLAARQMIKLQKAPDRLVSFLVGNITWMLIALIPLTALFMKLFYIRRNKYFIEHLVFMYHYHALVFIVLSILFLFLWQWPNSVLIATPLVLLLFLFLALKKYYKQGILKTAVKTVLLIFSYALSFLLFALATMAVSILLFP